MNMIAFANSRWNLSISHLKCAITITWIWWHSFAPTCEMNNIIMHTCSHGDLFMSTCKTLMMTCNIIILTYNILISHSHIVMLHVKIIMLHVDIKKLHVNIIMFHVDIIYLACREQKYTTILTTYNSDSSTENVYLQYMHRVWRSCFRFPPFSLAANHTGIEKSKGCYQTLVRDNQIKDDVFSVCSLATLPTESHDRGDLYYTPCNELRNE